MLFITFNQYKKSVDRYQREGRRWPASNFDIHSTEAPRQAINLGEPGLVNWFQELLSYVQYNLPTPGWGMASEGYSRVPYLKCISVPFTVINRNKVTQADSLGLREVAGLVGGSAILDNAQDAQSHHRWLSFIRTFSWVKKRPMVLWVRPTLTQLRTNVLYAPLNNTLIYLIPRVRWSRRKGKLYWWQGFAYRMQTRLKLALLSSHRKQWTVEQ